MSPSHLVPSFRVRPSSSLPSGFHHHRNILVHRPSFLLSSSSATTAAEEVAVAPVEWQGEVLQQLKQIIDPDLGADIVSLGFIQGLRLSTTKTADDGIVVSFDVALTTPACPVKDQFQADCIRLVEQLDWVSQANVTMTSQEYNADTAIDNDPTLIGLSQVNSIIAVASCKGGVGKSTTAVNLAFALSQMGTGTSVGIFDADLYGPSLPTMVTPDDEIVRFVGRQIAPLQRNGVRLMSHGFVNDANSGNVLRGPMITQVLEQLLRVTHWGKLDYLIVDMPPGTGDIALTLTQRLNVTAAVIVSTPQELSFVDVVRGVDMFDTVQVPCVAVVENMGYYCSGGESGSENKGSAIDWDAAIGNVLKEKTGQVDPVLAQALVETVQKELESSSAAASSTSSHSPSAEPIRIFGPGHKDRLANQFGIEHTYSVPLMTNISAAGDGGTPFVLQHPKSAAAAVYRDLAETVVKEVAKVKYSKKKDVLEFNAEKNVFVLDGAIVDPVTLRGECKCAVCVEEMTGRQLLDKSSVPDTIQPKRIYNTGNYAVSVDWSDGHRSLYPYRQVRTLLQPDVAEVENEDEALLAT